MGDSVAHRDKECNDRVFMVMLIYLLPVTVALSSISVRDIISGAWRAQYQSFLATSKVTVHTGVNIDESRTYTTSQCMHFCTVSDK